MSLRTVCTIFLLISVCAFPLYFTVAIGLFSVIWFRKYYELIPLYFLNDILYGIPSERFWGLPYVMTLLAVLFVAVSIVVRRQVLDKGLGTI